jgi:hypothetical protein
MTRKTNQKKKQTRKQKRKGGMWYTQNINKSCEDNLKDFNRTRNRRPPNEPYNPTTYYPGLFNVHSKPVTQSMHCTNSDTLVNQDDKFNVCREINRFMVSNYKQKRNDFVLHELYCCFNPNICEIDYYRCVRVFENDDHNAFGMKVKLSYNGNMLSVPIDMDYYNSLHRRKNTPAEDGQESLKAHNNDCELLYEINIPGKQILYKDKYENPIYEINLTMINRTFYIVGNHPRLLPKRVSPLMQDF